MRMQWCIGGCPHCAIEGKGNAATAAPACLTDGTPLPIAPAQVMMDFLKEWEEKLGIKITCSQASAG